MGELYRDVLTVDKELQKGEKLDEKISRIVIYNGRNVGHALRVFHVPRKKKTKKEKTLQEVLVGSTGLPYNVHKELSKNQKFRSWQVLTRKSLLFFKSTQITSVTFFPYGHTIPRELVISLLPKGPDWYPRGISTITNICTQSRATVI